MAEPYDVLIVGAGISGLMAANELNKRGKTVLVVDKGRGVGGRMSTRRIGPGRADHGAQFFTVRQDRFQTAVSDWIKAGVVHQWSSGWSDTPGQDAPTDGYPRYAGRNGMNQIPKYLAKSQNVVTQCQITQITAVSGLWTAVDTHQYQYTSHRLLLTPPVPQSLALLDAGHVSLPPAIRSALEKISYHPCIAGMFWVEGAVDLPAPGALQRPDHPFSWISNNQVKGISPDAQLITIHTNPELSWELWDEPDRIKIETLLNGLRPFLAPNAVIREAQAHRWRYARPITYYPQRTLFTQDPLPLAFAGDAFQEPRVEGAALSGLAAASRLA